MIMRRKTILIMTLLSVTILLGLMTAAFWSIQPDAAKVSGILTGLTLLTFAGLAMTTKHA
jgi:hypothetical protein